MSDFYAGDIVKFKIPKPYGAEVECDGYGTVVRQISQNYYEVAWIKDNERHEYSFHKNEIERV